MTDPSSAATVELAESVTEIGRAAGDACAGVENPFVGFDFLRCLEESGAATDATGWAPRHVLIRDADGGLRACAPVYVKGHSMGEYVFDHGWADAYERAGGRYYPKLLCAVPFTPVTGPRLLVRGDLAGDVAAGLRRQLGLALAGLTRDAGLSSAHVNFISQDDDEALRAAGFVSRAGLQYHWHNDGYRGFHDFLAALTARKRKAINRERRAVAAAGLVIERLSGETITEAHWDAFFAFYQDTGERKWGHAYLNRAFFRLIGERMANKVVLILASRDGRPIAGALNLMGADAIYGRYWGCSEDVPFLHFELCYHQAIEVAIERGLARVEAGAQGDHKIARGYLPVQTRSAHFIAHPGLRAAVADFTDNERRIIETQRDFLTKESPYRQGDDPGRGP